MSFANPFSAAGELVDPASEPGTTHHLYADSLKPASQENVYSSTDPFDEAMLDDLYAMDGKAEPSVEPPALPEKSSLRTSRFLENLSLQLTSAMKAQELGQTTPHDLYLSSEEDASSSADDFSDYSDFESGSEDGDGPTPRRRSREVIARAVSVVFSGKPSIINLPSPRRSASRTHLLRERSNTLSTVSTVMSSTSSSSSATSVPSSSAPSPRRPSSRSSGLAPSQLLRRKPHFLNIDPYANGSTYSLDLPGTIDEAAPARPKTPLTPTALLKGASRTLSLVRKRSRPLLSNRKASASGDALTTMISSASESEAEAGAAQRPSSPTPAAAAAPQTPTTPSSSYVTYNDILRAAKKNSIMMPPSPSPASSPESARRSVSGRGALPQSPSSSSTGGFKRGILSGLAARRRSIKLAGKPL